MLMRYINDVTEAQAEIIDTKTVEIYCTLGHIITFVTDHLRFITNSSYLISPFLVKISPQSYSPLLVFRRILTYAHHGKYKTCMLLNILLLRSSRTLKSKFQNFELPNLDNKST